MLKEDGMTELLEWARLAAEDEVFIPDGYDDGYQRTGYMVPRYQHVFDNLNLEEALGLKWETLRTEHVSDNLDDDGDHVSTTTHLWQTLPRWGAYRDYDQTSMTTKGMDKMIRSVWSPENIQSQFDKPSAFASLFRSEATEGTVAAMYDINREVY